MKEENIETIKSRLYHASTLLADMCLFQASKWCAEALNGLPQDEDKKIMLFEFPDIETSPLELTEKYRMSLARSYFYCKEFERAAYTLKNCKSGDALFLRLYSKFISIDKKATEETEGFVNLGSTPFFDAKKNHNELPDTDSPSSKSQEEMVANLNTQLTKILQESENYNSNPENKPNSFLYFLNGIIYNKKKKYAMAQSNLFKSLRIFPYNWSCWQELIATLNTLDEATSFIHKLKVSKTPFTNLIMFQFFEVVILQEFYQQLEALDDILNLLLEIFPNFNFLKVQQFLIAYHSLDYFRAETIFDHILALDPLRLDDLDTYSNMLYVMEKRSKLSYLAQYASLIDKFRPETCCIIANYHSMKCEHEKAIMYYKRALTLNKNCLSAWTLMGHEFVELKNSHAGIESYRRAVDINPKDFRAWYGLGQAYEVLDMHLYASYYYQKATSLQPLDKRMWQAIGNCYEKIEKFEEAIKAFEKALSIDSYSKMANEKTEEIENHEPHICYKLATISEKLGRHRDTLKFMKLCFDQEFVWGITDETSKARLWLSRNALENRQYEEAYELAKDLNHSNAHDIEEARSIAREARNRML